MELRFHPRYQPLLVDDNPFGFPPLMDVHAEVRRLDAGIEGLSAGLKRLSEEDHGLQEVRELMRMHRQERGWVRRR